MRAKPDGLTPVALRAKRPLIAPSRPSSSRLFVSQSPRPPPVYRALLHLLNLLNLLLGRACHSVVLVGTSQTCRGCRENFSLPGCGAAPHIPSIPISFPSYSIGVRQHAQNLHQSVSPKVFLAKRRNNLRFPFVSFVILRVLCDSQRHTGSPACGSTPPASVPLCLLCVLCVPRNLRFPASCFLWVSVHPQ